MSRIFAALALLLALLPLSAGAAELPALTGRVVDTAGLLDADTRAALTATLAGFEQKSSDQIVVATVPGLDGEAIEPFANRLFRAWQLGQSGENNGVLLLVARDDRKMRIEVGYGLEGTLTDLHSKLIIEDTMVPAFRAGDFSGGISRAVDDIITVLEGEGAELEARRARNEPAGEGFPPELILFGIVWISIFGLGLGGAILPPLFGRRIGPKRYRWLGMNFDYTNSGRRGRSAGWTTGTGSGWSSGSSGGGWSSGGRSSGGGGFSGGGGSSGGGGASGSW